MNQRAELLAARLEEGAARLAAFSESISDAEWTKPVRGGRPVGVIVHHVASVYPIEIALAQKIGSGTPVADVPWAAVHDMNAQHASQNDSASKGETLALLRRNSSEAAAAVRAMSDKELDTAAAFSLSFDAPMTAQFVIEDHAMRHSWHHLAGIKAELGR